MSKIDPRRDALPDEFPAFPLSGAVLLPHARLPLNIFEPRYLAMIEDALAAGRMIGMIQPNPGEPAVPAGPALHRVGCLGRLMSFAETEDGRYLITLGGVIRFTVAAELGMSRGYRRVRGAFAEYLGDLPALPEGSAGLDRTALFAALAGFFTRRGVEANWTALEQMGDAAVVATLAMGCPFAPMEKQALLEAPTLAKRAETLLTLLQIDMHGGVDDQTLRPS